MMMNKLYIIIVLNFLAMIYIISVKFFKINKPTDNTQDIDNSEITENNNQIETSKQDIENLNNEKVHIDEEYKKQVDDVANYNLIELDDFFTKRSNRTTDN